MKISDLINEAMQRDSFKYKSVRPNYKLNGEDKNIIILDPSYPPGNPDSYLAFDLNVLKGIDKNLIKKIQKIDSKLVGVKRKKGILMSIQNKGFYPDKKEIKIDRYKDLTLKFPQLKKCIRRYKNKGVLK